MGSGCRLCQGVKEMIEFILGVAIGIALSELHQRGLIRPAFQLVEKQDLFDQ